MKPIKQIRYKYIQAHEYLFKDNPVQARLQILQSYHLTSRRLLFKIYKSCISKESSFFSIAQENIKTSKFIPTVTFTHLMIL